MNLQFFSNPRIIKRLGVNNTSALISEIQIHAHMAKNNCIPKWVALWIYQVFACGSYTAKRKVALALHKAGYQVVKKTRGGDIITTAGRRHVNIEYALASGYYHLITEGL